MPLPFALVACFRGPKEPKLVASPSSQPPLACATSQGLPVVVSASVAGCPSCTSRRDEDSSLAVERNIPYTPRDTSQRRSFCVELAQPSVRPEQRSKVEYTTADELVKDVQNLRWLGQGAQGVVYEGIWQGATVAVKFSVVEDLDATAYELLFSRLLSHPNVVQTYLAKVAVLDERTVHRCLECGGGGGGGGRCDHSLLSRPSLPGCGKGTPGRGTAGGGGGASAATASSLYRPGGGAGTDSGYAAAGSASIPSVIARCGSSSVAASTAAAGSPIASRRFAATGGGVDGSGRGVPTPRGGGGGGGGFSGSISLSAATAAAACCTDPDLMQSGALQRAGRSDSFQSDDGFGNPFGRRSTFTDVREVLASMGARPGHFITQMVMEHCDHGSLHAAIQRGIFKPASRWGPKLALRALIRTAREVAQGMFHLHANNVLHGDLKPANVLLINSRKDRRGYVAKVSDFGMAQFCPMDHISNAPWGTLVYMAPERLLHGQLFPASDVYSFGVMLWEMYHGQRPYEGMHVAQIVMACAQGCACLEWSEDSCPDVVRLSRACMVASPHGRPTFQWLMHELALLESKIRLDGMRVSKSLDAGSSRPSSRLSSEVGTSRLQRGCTSVSGMHAAKHRVSLDTAVQLGPGAAAATAAATAAAAAAAAASASSSRRCSKEVAAAGSSRTLPGGRYIAGDGCCHSGSPALPRPAPSHGSVGAQAAAARLPQPSSGSAMGTRPGAHAAASVGGAAAAALTSGGGGGGLVTTGDQEAGRRSAGGSAAAIAAALAQQPDIASAVVSELIALLQQQQQQQQQQRQTEVSELADSSTASAVWAAAAPGPSRNVSSGGGDGGGCGGGGGGGNSGLWRRSSSGLGGVLPPPPPPPPQPQPQPQPQAFQPATCPTCTAQQLGEPSDDQIRGGDRPHTAGGNDDGATPGRGPSPPPPPPPPPQHSMSCGGLGAGGEGGPWEGSGTLPMPATEAGGGGLIAIMRISRSSTDTALADDPGGGGGAVGGGDRSCGGRWDGAAAAAAPTSLTDDGPLLAATAATHVDALSPREKEQQQQLQPGVGCSATTAPPHRPLVRRRSSNLAAARRGSNSPGWECPTITEEPL